MGSRGRRSERFIRSFDRLRGAGGGVQREGAGGVHVMHWNWWIHAPWWFCGEGCRSLASLQNVLASLLTFLAFLEDIHLASVSLVAVVASWSVLLIAETLLKRRPAEVASCGCAPTWPLPVLLQANEDETFIPISSTFSSKFSHFCTAKASFLAANADFPWRFPTMSDLERSSEALFVFCLFCALDTFLEKPAVYGFGRTCYKVLMKTKSDCRAITGWLSSLVTIVI